MCVCVCVCGSVCVCILFVSPWWDGPSVGCHGDALRAGPVEVVLAVDSERVRVCVRLCVCVCVCL